MILFGQLGCRAADLSLSAAGFQSTPDDTMPMRMLYVAALYDHLLRSKAVDIADGLPPVLPSCCITVTPLAAKQRAVLDPPASTRAQTVSAAAEILAVGRRRLPAAELEDMQRVMAAIFVLNTRRTLRRPSVRFAVLADAIAKSPFKQRLDRVLAHWVKYRLETRMPGLNTPDADRADERNQYAGNQYRPLGSPGGARGCRRIQQGMQQGCNKACSWAKPCCCNASSPVVLANCPPPSRRNYRRHARPAGNLG